MSTHTRNMKSMDKFWELLFAITIYTSLSPSQSAMIQGDSFYKDLQQLANDGLGVAQIQSYFDKEVKYSRKSVDGPEAIQQLQTALTQKFDGSVDAVHKLRDKLEELHTEPLHDKYKAELCCEATDLEYDPYYKQKVNKNKMCIIGKDGLKKAGVKFLDTDKVLKQLRDNYEKNEKLKWQYFSDENGILYTYPSAKVCTDHDWRYRPWYVETATPNGKDVVLIIDKSGSMRNVYETTTLMKIAQDAAQTVVGTLNPKDRIGVVAFSTNAQTPSGKLETSACYSSHLAKAIPENKQYLNEFISYITEGGITNYGKALEKAFTLIRNTPKEPDEEKRNKVILFLTDAEPTDPVNKTLNLLKELNAEMKNKYVVLTYGLGNLDKGDMEVLEKLAQQTFYNQSVGDIKRGVFELVVRPENLRSEMASYYNFFSHTGDIPKVVYSVPYQDAFGTGILISACLQVRNKTGGNELVGITCSDISEEDLFTDVTYFQQGELSYAFLVHESGRVGTHPLYPRPLKISDSPVFLYIKDLERSTAAAEIFEEIKSGRAGSKQISSQRVLSRGNTVSEGVLTKNILSTYYWAPISSTGFSVVIVIAEGDEIVKLDDESKFQNIFPYHRLDLLTNPGALCNDYGRLATTEHSTIKFSAECFKEAYEHLSTEEQKQDVEAYHIYMTGRTDTSDTFVEGVRSAVAVSAKVDKIWTSETGQEAANFSTSRYIATVNGVFRAYPGHLSAQAYDPKVRPWYKRAIATKLFYAMSTPYKDAKTSGLVLTLSKTIFESKVSGGHSEDGRPIAVMGMDFTLPHFYALLVKKFPICNNADYVCFVIDMSGHVVLHKDMVDLESAKLPQITGVHLTMKEPVIAKHLIANKKLAKDACIDYAQKHKNVFWKLRLDADEKVLTENFEIHGVPQSNIFIGIKKENSDPFKTTCSCSSSTSDRWKCVNASCECPCYTKADYDYCSNKFSTTQDSSPPCVPETKGAKLDLTVEQTEKNLAKTKSACYNFNCKERTKSSCTGVIGCSWCKFYAGGKPLENPRCDDSHRCVFGVSTEQPAVRPPEPSTTTTPSVDDVPLTPGVLIAAIAVPIAVLLLVGGAVGLFIFLKKRRASQDNGTTFHVQSSPSREARDNRRNNSMLRVKTDDFAPAS